MRVLLGLSGGVDSTYSIKILQAQEYDVECAVVIMSEHTDIASAQESARATGVKLHILDAEVNFQKYVVDNFVSEYTSARTPNPCVMCNRYVKIQTLCDFANENGFDKVATGHYVGVVEENGRYAIRKGEDSVKDQSYVLWQLTQEQLSMLMTPLYNIGKDEVRANTQKEGLEAANRKESQDICFIPDGDYVTFIEERNGKMKKGSFIDEEGNVLGKHQGILHYTVGQRKGLGIALGEPMFVREINAEDNTVTLVPKGKEFCSGMIVDGLNFQSEEPRNGIIEDVSVKVRYAAKPIPCRVEVKNDTATVIFDEKIRAVTPGQSAVFYRNNTVVFGGFIRKAHK